MKPTDKEHKEILSILFVITLLLFVSIACSLFIYYPSQIRYIKNEYPVFFFIIKIFLPGFLFILKHLHVFVIFFVPFSFLFRIFLGKHFYFKENANQYQYRFIYLICAFLLPEISLFIYTSYKWDSNTLHFTNAIITILFLFIGYGLFSLFLRLQYSGKNQFATDFHERLQMPKKELGTEHSINLKIAPRYHINITNPYRGIMIIGGPGCGKSYGIIEPIIDQIIHKGFTSLIYDFKFPTLSAYAYAAYADAKSKGKTKAEFRVIYFRDPRYSHRCNPLDPKLLTEYATANQAASTILLNINRTWAQKQGEFFSDSAIIILTSIIWYLRCKSLELGTNICSLAHVIEFASYADYTKTIEILTEHPEVKNTIVALQSAKQTGAMEQLGGQLGSMQIAMSKLNDKKMLYVMSGSDFTLDINVPGNEQVVILGNDNEFKDTYAPALSLYAAICTRLINQKNRKPCALIIDEFPTIYIQNYEQLPATARSNKVACIIAMQDLAQLRDSYGQSKEKTITATHGNIFVGSTPEKDTAHYASELIGKDIIQKKSYSNKEKANYNISEQVDLVIYPHEIQQLNVGEFVGQVSDLDDSLQNTSFFSPSAKIKKVFAGSLATVKPAHYYTGKDKKEFKHQIPKNPIFDTPQFNSLSESEQEAFVDKIVTDNINAIRKETIGLIEFEFWFTLIWRYLDTDNNKTKRDFILLSRDLPAHPTELQKRKAIADYINTAIQEERTIKSDPSRANQVSKATTLSLQLAIEEIDSDTEAFWALKHEEENPEEFNDYPIQ